MDASIKKLAEAITHTHTQNLIQSHVKALQFNEVSQHLIVVVNNAGPLHELENEEGDKHLKAGLEKVYGEDITYELKLPASPTHERENAVGHNIHQ